MKYDVRHSEDLTSPGTAATEASFAPHVPLSQLNVFGTRRMVKEKAKRHCARCSLKATR